MEGKRTQYANLHVVQPADEVASHAAIRCCQPCSGAHNLAIAPRLASVGALSDSMMLAASTGWCGRSARKLALLFAGLKQSARFFPSALPMLGAGQRET